MYNQYERKVDMIKTYVPSLFIELILTLFFEILNSGFGEK